MSDTPRSEAAQLEMAYDSVTFAAREVLTLVAAPQAPVDPKIATMERLLTELAGETEMFRATLQSHLGEALLEMAQHAHAAARMAVLLQQAGVPDPVGDVMTVLRKFPGKKGA